MRRLLQGCSLGCGAVLVTVLTMLIVGGGMAITLYAALDGPLTSVLPGEVETLGDLVQIGAVILACLFPFFALAWAIAPQSPPPLREN